MAAARARPASAAEETEEAAGPARPAACSSAFERTTALQKPFSSSRTPDPPPEVAEVSVVPGLVVAGTVEVLAGASAHEVAALGALLVVVIVEAPVVALVAVVGRSSVVLALETLQGGVGHEGTSAGTGGEAKSGAGALEVVDGVGELAGRSGLRGMESGAGADDASLCVEEIEGIADSVSGAAGSSSHAPGSVEDGDLAEVLGEGEVGGWLVHGFSGGGASREAWSSRMRFSGSTSWVRQGSARGLRWWRRQ